MQVFIAYILTAGSFLKILRSLFESKTLFFSKLLVLIRFRWKQTKQMLEEH